MTVGKRVKHEVSRQGFEKSKMVRSFCHGCANVYAGPLQSALFSTIRPCFGSPPRLLAHLTGCSLYYASDVVSPRPVTSRSAQHSDVPWQTRPSEALHKSAHPPRGACPRRPAPADPKRAAGRAEPRGGPETRSGPALQSDRLRSEPHFLRAGRGGGRQHFLLCS